MQKRKTVLTNEQVAIIAVLAVGVVIGWCIFLWVVVTLGIRGL